MKLKIALFSILLSILCFSCNDDDMNSIGMGMGPDGDKIAVYDTIMKLEGMTVKLDSLFARSSFGYLGNYYDEDYGDIKAGYMCQYYPSIGFDLDSIVRDGIDSVRMHIYYYTYLGDSITPMEVTVYPINRELEEDYYINAINPSDYCDMQNPWAKQAYTARDLSVSDSINDDNNANGYMKKVVIPLDNTIGARLYEKYKETGDIDYNNLNDFLDFFPGTYQESSFGTGSILCAELTGIYVYYTRYTTELDTLDNPIIVEKPAAAAYTATKEVIQINTFENRYDSHLLQPSNDFMYLKTPGGICSKITIPIPEIKEHVKNMKFSTVTLSLKAKAGSDSEYALNFPGIGATANSASRAKLLLIEPDSVKSFFEGTPKVADNMTTYSTMFDWATNTYDFVNIANVVQNAMEKAPDKDLELLVIPVQVEYYTYSSSIIDYATYYYLMPSAVTLRKGGENIQIQIIASDLESEIE
jgi:hypothetical protein